MAPAAGTAPAQTLTTAFGALAAHTGQPLTVTDVVAPADRDSMALSPFFLILGVLFPSVAAGRPPRWSSAARVGLVVGRAGPRGRGDRAWPPRHRGRGPGLGNYPALAGIVALFSLAVAAADRRPRPDPAAAWALAVLVFVVFGLPASGGPSGLGPFGPAFPAGVEPGAAAWTRGRGRAEPVYFGGYGDRPAAVGTGRLGGGRRYGLAWSSPGGGGPRRR